MDSLEANLLRLQRFDPRIIVAVAVSCAQRGISVYDDLGSGDPSVLHDAVDSLWGWIEQDTEFANASDVRDLLQEYADAHFEEEDELLGHLVSCLPEAIEAYLAIGTDDCSVHAARALEAHAELCEQVDDVLENAGLPPRAVAEETAWRDAAMQYAQRVQPPVKRGDFGAPVASWIADVVAAG